MSTEFKSLEEDNDILLVLRADGVLLPVYGAAIHIAEGWPWKIKRQYTNAVLIRKNGLAQEVKQVSIVGPYGRSFLAKVFSVLNSNWLIALQLSNPETASIPLIRAVIQGLELDNTSGRGLFGQATISFTEITSIEQVFQKLRLDDPQFVALDSL
jgi:hypothetical protein